ncbi:MAG: AEC family transporter [Firmicutes bacterium]|nr:AEC family transporter [Bacillota bacterium]
MEKFLIVAEAVIPVFVSIFLGIFARKKQLLKPEEIRGIQQFVVTFALPFVLFQSCYTADFGLEAITSMAMVLPLMLLGTCWAFSARKRRLPYHNLPQLFAAQETGMLGISLFVALFGMEQAYRMGVLDLAQAFVAIPVIAILSSSTGESPSVAAIVKKVFQSPLLLMSLLGLTLNLSGIAEVLDSIGIGGILIQTSGFLAQPVSAAILFAVGYNFSLEREGLRPILHICLIHTAFMAVFCAIMQGILFLLPTTDPETRFAAALFCALPPSFLSSGLGRTAEDSKVASGVCSILTVVTLILFCFIAALAS